MTSPSFRRLVRLSVDRDQVVAALLVGGVVILLGFASGLGIETTAATPTPSTVAPVPVAALPPDTTRPVTAVAAAPAIDLPPGPPAPVDYVGRGTPEPASPLMGPAPSARSGGTSGPGSAGSTRTPTPTPTAPACSPGLLTQLLATLNPLPGATSTTTAAPARGGLLAGLTSGGGLGDLLPITPDTTASTATSLLGLTPTQLLDQVTALLSLPGLATLTSSPGSGVAGACASTLTHVLPLVARGMTLQQAATTNPSSSAMPATHR